MSRNTYKTGAQAEYDAARIFNLELNEVRHGPRARNSPDAYGPAGEPIEIKKASLNKGTGYWQVSHLYKSKGVSTRLIIQIDKTFYDIRDKEVLNYFFNQDTVTLRPNVGKFNSDPIASIQNILNRTTVSYVSTNIDKNTKLLKEMSTAVIDEGQDNRKNKETLSLMTRMLNFVKDNDKEEYRQRIEEYQTQPAYV